MELIRKGNEVFFGTQKLTINPQATKGPNKEVVKIEGLEGSNGQKWYSLTKLKEGVNQIECQGRELVVTSTRQPYVLTSEEKSKVDELQSQIDSIIEVAKSRYVKKPDLKVDPSKLTQEQKLELAKQLEAYLALVKG